MGDTADIQDPLDCLWCCSEGTGWSRRDRVYMCVCVCISHQNAVHIPMGGLTFAGIVGGLMGELMIGRVQFMFISSTA